MKIPDWLVKLSRFDPGQFDPQWQPAKAIIDAWKWFGRRVTGHSAHALNAWVVAKYVLFFLPMLVAFTIMAFLYTVREWPFKTADNRGDVLWVYTVLIALWGPWWIGGVVVVPLLYDLWYWFLRDRISGGVWVRGKPAGWMPRDWTMLPYWRRRWP